MMDRWMINLCPFLHFDNSRHETYEHNISIVSWNVKSVLDYLDVNSAHKFCMDQVTLLEGFKRLFPNYWDALHQRVLEGRIEIVGGTYVQPDFVIPDGESIARQFLFGLTFIREELGIEVKTGWGTDSSGHCSQLPQILRQCGISSYFFYRGMPFDAPTEFVWKGPDGSRVNSVWMSMGSDCAAWLSENTREAFTALLDTANHVGPRASSKNILIPVGGELVPPPPHLADITDEWNRTFPDMRMVIVTPHEFSEKVKSVQASLAAIAGPLISGRFSPTREGGLSSRVKLKLMNRQLEKLLYLTELYLSAADIHDKELELSNVWRILLFNQDHNIIRGTIADEPYQLAVRRYEQAIKQSEDILEGAIEEFCNRIETGPNGTSFVVFNPLPWTRTDVVRISLPIDKQMIGRYVIVDASDKPVPFQLLDDCDSNADILILARGMPSLGYRIYRVKESDEPIEHAAAIKSGKNWVESDNYIIEFDSFSGAITRLFDKNEQFECLRNKANFITYESDVGDLYRFERSSLSSEKSILTSLRSSGQLRIIEDGPVRCVTEITGQMNGSERTQRVIIYEGIPRVDIETELEFYGQDKRVSLSFPLSVFSAQVTAGAPFGAETRSLALCSNDNSNGHEPTFPAIDWVDCSGPDHGICISIEGLREFRFKDGVLSATLLRSLDHLSRGKDDHIIETPLAKEHGSHRFRATIVPHKSDWREARVWRTSEEHRIPLISYPLNAVPTEAHLEESLLAIDGSELMLTCFKPTKNKGEVILRFYEMIGRAGTATLRFNKKIKSAVLVDLCEREIGDLAHSVDQIDLPVEKHSIMTLRVSFQT